MAVRKALAYSKRKPVVNTRRSKKQHLSYVKMVPPQKIVKFNMGDPRGFELGKYPVKVVISTEENIQIRDLALEAARQSINKDLTKAFTKNYFLRCHCYPHNITRNNRVFSGASKGERVQTGMTLGFGTPEGRTAIVKAGKPVFSAFVVDEKMIPQVKAALVKVKAKLPCATRIVAVIPKKPAQ